MPSVKTQTNTNKVSLQTEVLVLTVKTNFRGCGLLTASSFVFTHASHIPNFIKNMGFFTIQHSLKSFRIASRYFTHYQLY